MYDFPRSHQIETSESLPCTLLRRHCYNNAAPVKIEGQIFRYDISPKPSTSSVQVCICFTLISSAINCKCV